MSKYNNNDILDYMELELTEVHEQLKLSLNTYIDFLSNSDILGDKSDLHNENIRLACKTLACFHKDKIQSGIIIEAINAMLACEACFTQKLDAMENNKIENVKSLEKSIEKFKVKIGEYEDSLCERITQLKSKDGEFCELRRFYCPDNICDILIEEIVEKIK